MIRYYREKSTGDYLAVDISTLDYYQRVVGKELYEGQATCIDGNISSVSTCTISPRYLKWCCKKVARKDIPAEWLKALGYHQPKKE